MTMNLKEEQKERSHDVRESEGYQGRIINVQTVIVNDNDLEGFLEALVSPLKVQYSNI